MKGRLEGVIQVVAELLEFALEIVEAHLDELAAAERLAAVTNNHIARNSGLFGGGKEPIHRFALGPIGWRLFGPARRRRRGRCSSVVQVVAQNASAPLHN